MLAEQAQSQGVAGRPSGCTTSTTVSVASSDKEAGESVGLRGGNAALPHELVEAVDGAPGVADCFGGDVDEGVQFAADEEVAWSSSSA